jgi:hemoglobin-like flavoprotein
MKTKCENISAHTRAIVMQLDMIVHCLDTNMDHQLILMDVFQDIGERHANLGVQSRHYFLLEEAMLSMLEYSLKSSSGYWNRVQKSWSALFRMMFGAMKHASKNEEHRQQQMARSHIHKERRSVHTSPPQKNHSLNTITTTTTTELSTTDFSLSSHDSAYAVLPTIPSDKRVSKFPSDKTASKSMRNLLAASTPDRPSRKDMLVTNKDRPMSMRNLFAADRPSRKDMLVTNEDRPMSMRNLFAADSPATPKTKRPTKSTSMRNIFAKESPTCPGKSPEKTGNKRSTSVRNLFAKNHSGHGAPQVRSHPTSLPPPPPPSNGHGSPRSVACPSPGRPGISRAHSRRRDCAVFAVDSPGTPGSRRRAKKNHSPTVESTPNSQLRRKMSKGGVDLIMSNSFHRQ